MHKCDYCNGIFSTKSNLSYHKRNANYCLKIRGIENIKIFECMFCDKILSSERKLKTHSKNCTKRIIIDYEKKISQINYEKDSILQKLKEKIDQN